MRCNVLIDNLGLEFARKEIDCARNSGRLLTLDIELSRQCNFKCIYCYSNAGHPLADELNFEQISSTILQGKCLGAKKIIIVGGGEPLIYPHLKEIIDVIRNNGMKAVVFTNGTNLDPALAKFFYMRQVAIVLKMNSMNPSIQDYLCGIHGTSAIIDNALNNLFDVGYPGNDHMLGIASVICRYNCNEIADLWRWARQKNIVPYIETLTPQGRGKSEDLSVDKQTLKHVFENLSSIDSREFSISWDSIHPPLAGLSCLRHLYSCYVKSDGSIQPCAGIEISTGNVKNSSLEGILSNSPIMKDMKNIDYLVKGKCKTCNLNPDCYGCRGGAFQSTGDYLAEDPLCWYQDAYEEK